MKNLKFLIPLSCCLLVFSCPKDDSIEEEIEQQIKNVTYEVIFFTYIKDTGNNTSRLSYEITFSNPNDSAIQGFSKITTNADGFMTSTISSNKSQCYSIDANADCTYSFDAEESHDLGIINSIELESVSYTISN
ncbi:MAG: hypothetical protein P8K68_03910 [Algibacter sp.]|uniref:hypothetical protein n=1 Tax=Algibacter sp. TaxID=1872428 RepID=UPI00260B54BC|nr:hypothetical protein [Algibacter sp.]MDG1729765.1 hypothetical protein [Algibacter sp.]MDG2177919.1 hypothetical protein [Algibacter sp.]